MDIETSLLIDGITLISSLGVSWGVVKSKTEEHSKRIAENSRALEAAHRRIDELDRKQIKMETESIYDNRDLKQVRADVHLMSRKLDSVLARLPARLRATDMDTEGGGDGT